MDRKVIIFVAAGLGILLFVVLLMKLMGGKKDKLIIGKDREGGVGKLRRVGVRRGTRVEHTIPTNRHLQRTSVLPAEGNYGNGDILSFDLELSTELGEPIVSFTLGGENLKAVADTGSSMLVIASSQCSQCNTELGTWPASKGSWTGLRSSQVYGSQSVETELVDVVGIQQLTSLPVRFAASLSGSSDAVNIMGLAQTSNPATFTPQLSVQGGVRPILNFDFAGGRLVIGSLPTATNAPGTVAIPFVPPNEIGTELGISNYPSQTFFTRVEAITGIPKEETPRFAIWDSGTTCSLMPPKVLAYFQQNRQNFTITFGSQAEQKSWSWDSSYIDDMETNTDSNGNYWLGSEMIMLIGNRFMYSALVTFDTNSHTLFLNSR